MSRVGGYLILSLVLVLLVGGCAQLAVVPSPVCSPTATVTAVHTPTPVLSPTPAREAIPGDGMTVTLASEGDEIVAGEVDGTTGLAYFLDSAGWLYVFDGASLEVVAKEQVLSAFEGFATYPATTNALGSDSGSGRVYVADGARQETLILDSETLSPLGSIDACGNIAVDPVTHRVYIAQMGVYVADGESGEIIDQIEETIPEEGMEDYSGIAHGVDVHINPANRHLYVMMYDNWKSWWLDLFDADDYRLLGESLPSGTDQSGEPAFDLERGLDYLSGYPEIQGDHKLVALDKEGREVGHLFSVGGKVFYSPRHDLLYVNRGLWEDVWLDLIDAETMDYLGSYALWFSLHDPLNGRFYSLDPIHATRVVTVFDEPTVSLAPGSAIESLRGPLPSAPDSLVLSPAFSSDQTIFAPSRASLLASSDAGESWTEMTLPFLNRGRVEVVLSPAYAQDKTLFVGFACEPLGSGILRSVDGGDHWTRVNTGLTDLGIEALFVSPGYAQDRTVFAMTCADGPFKSTDGGETWRPLTVDFLPSGPSYRRVRQLSISPAYPRDGHLWLLAAPHVYLSKDGGETWQQADRGLEELSPSRLVLSPTYEVDKTVLATLYRGISISRNEGQDWQAMQLPIPELRPWVPDLSPGFASDSTLFVAGSDEEYNDHLYRSTDGGQAWLALGEGLWGQSFEGLTLSPDYPADGLVFASTDEGVYRSTDRGDTWTLLSIPGARLLVFSPDFSSDRIIYASLGEELYRSDDGGESWRALHQPTLTVSTPVPTAAPSPAPISSPTPTGCTGPELDPTFQPIADRVESLRPGSTDLPQVGCPTEAAQTRDGVWQLFLVQAPDSTGTAPDGYMIWRSDSRTIYVIPQGDTLAGSTEVMVYEDTWTEDMPEIPPSCAGLIPPTGLQMPTRGFGKVWCENNLRDLIGFGYGSEKPTDLFIQEAERGLYMSVPEVGTFVIDVVNGRVLSMYE
jgi:photosystem II stability/assembly factor-like uncharacterized protein